MPQRWPDPRHFGSLQELAATATSQHTDDETVALVGDDGRLVPWRGRDLRRRSDLAAWRLRALGLRTGDRLLTWSPSGPELAALYLGAIRAGIVLVPLDLRMTSDVIERIAELADARWLALGSGRDGPDPREVELGPVALRTVDFFVAEPGATDAHSHVGDVSFPPDWEAQLAGWPLPTRDTLFAIMFTSGTTGHPKGAILSHGNLLATIEATDHLIPRRQHRIVSVLPLSHLFGQLELLYALFAGAPILYVRSRNPRVIFAAIRDHRVTTMVVVPQVLELFWTAIQREIDRRGRGRAVARLRALARHLPFGLRRLLFGPVHAQLGGGLTLFVCAAAFLPPALQQAWEELGVAVMQGYGATECGFAVAHSPDDHHLGTVGRPMPPSRVRIDPASGEIQVSGPTVFQGYWRDAQATAAALGDDGWYHTGDVGHWDRSGYLVLSGRIKDMIVLPNGFNVFPEDIENALREAGLRDTVVLETAPGRIEAVVLPPDAWAIAEGVAPPPGPTRRPEEGVELRRQIDAAVRTANARLDAQQRVAAWRLWPGADFPRTHTLKVKRDLVRAWVSADAPSSAIS